MNDNEDYPNLDPKTQEEFMVSNIVGNIKVYVMLSIGIWIDTLTRTDTSILMLQGDERQREAR